VLGAMAGVVGSIQALEALKLLTGVGDPLLDAILQVDGASMAFTRVATERRADCPACARVPAASHSG
jgi:adenylyltransferase/sulfurtransferase